MDARVKPWKRTLLVIVVLLTILSLLLSACGPVEKSNGSSNHGKDKDKDKLKDSGKEKNNDPGGQAEIITICHKTGSAKNPYKPIGIHNDAAKGGHAKHEGDLIPAPEGGCPGK